MPHLVSSSFLPSFLPSLPNLLKRNEAKRKRENANHTTSSHNVLLLPPLRPSLQKKNVIFRKRNKSKVGGQLIFERNGK